MDSRRVFCKRMLSAAFFLAGGFVVAGCGGGSGSKKQETADSTAGTDDAMARFGGNCDDFSMLTEDDYKVREQLGYQKVSPTEETQCQQCNLWLPPRPDESCGGCTLFKGPIEPQGTCTYWAPRQS